MIPISLRFLFLFLSLVSAGCSTFLIPKQLTKEDLTQILALIKDTQQQKLVSVKYFSENRTPRTPHWVGDSNYGVSLYFEKDSCSGGTGYVFVREEGKWVQDSVWFSVSPWACP